MTALASPESKRGGNGLRYFFEGGGYTVLLDGKFVGRVTRSRSSYDHSNGRTYRSWSWSAFPTGNKVGAFHHRTRASAGQYLRRVLEEN